MHDPDGRLGIIVSRHAATSRTGTVRGQPQEKIMSGRIDWYYLRKG